MLIVQVSIFLSLFSENTSIDTQITLKSGCEYREKSSTNYHKICVNVNAKFFCVVDQFQFKFIETFLLLFVSFMCACDFGRGLKANERGFGTSWCQLMEKLFISTPTPHSIDPTCSNLNFHPNFQQISPPLQAWIVNARKKIIPTSQRFKQTNRPFCFPGLDNRVKNWLNMDLGPHDEKSQPICTTTSPPLSAASANKKGRK